MGVFVPGIMWGVLQAFSLLFLKAPWNRYHYILYHVGTEIETRKNEVHLPKVKDLNSACDFHFTEQDRKRRCLPSSWFANQEEGPHHTPDTDCPQLQIQPVSH